MKVRGISRHTAGVVPTTLRSQVFGEVNMYDFAGHEEYYASHEMILQQTSHPLVLVTVDISQSRCEIEKQVAYWLSILSNYSVGDVLESMNVFIVGSHADQVKNEEKGKIEDDIATLMKKESAAASYCGFFHCDCRYSTSNCLSQLRQKLSTVCKSVRLVLAHRESTDSNRHCAALMYFLDHNVILSGKITLTVSELCTLIREVESHDLSLARLANQALLVETCQNLNSSGHLLFLSHNESTDQSLLVLDEKVILSKVHACLADIRKELLNEFGVLDEDRLKRVLTESLDNAIEPELAIKYLLFTQFCTKIAADQLLSAPETIRGVVYYFFPNLALAVRPADLLSTSVCNYTHLYTWCLKCSKTRQFFTPRFLHTLFIQLVKCKRDAVGTEYSIWKNGILLVHNNGTKSMIEVTNQSTRVYVTMQCMKECETHLVRQRSTLVSLIKSLTSKVCPNIKVEGSLLLPHSTYPPAMITEIPISKVGFSAMNSYKTVSYKDNDEGTPQHVLTTDLLLFDSLFSIESQVLKEIFSQNQSEQVVPLATMRNICSSIEECSELCKIIKDNGLRYSKLCKKLIQYSIFSEESIIALQLATFETQPYAFYESGDCDPELTIAPLCSTLHISDLYLVNVNLISIAPLWKDFGLALLLSTSTLERIKSCYLQFSESSFTEVLAAWLKGEDRPLDSPGPTWGELIAALKSLSVNRRELASQLVHRLRSVENSMGECGSFSSVDDTELNLDSVREVAEYVQDLNHKWFHLGLSLGLRYPTLKNIEASHHHDVGDHMTDMLLKWLKGVDLETTRGVSGPPSWRSLALALDCPLVRERQVASKVQTDREYQSL